MNIKYSKKRLDAPGYASDGGKKKLFKTYTTKNFEKKSARLKNTEAEVRRGSRGKGEEGSAMRRSFS